MRKISRIIVKDMTMLTNEQMAMITGGEFTVYDCYYANDGKTCAVSYDATTGYMKLGTCHGYSVVSPTGFDYYAYCS